MIIIVALAAASFILAVALLIAISSPVIVVTSEEEILMDGRGRLVVYPDIPSREAIWSPIAALAALSDGVDVPDGSACYGLVDEGLDEVFTHVFIPDEGRLWSAAFDACPEAILLYDSEDAKETELSAGRIAVAFQGRLNGVTGDRTLDELEADGATALAIPSPEKASALLSDWQGVLVVPAIYMNAFENGQEVIAVGEDFGQMWRIMHSGQGGIHETPYRTIE